MKKWQKTLMLSAIAFVVIGLALYGGISLYHKLDKVDKLKEQIVDAEPTPAQEPTRQPNGPEPSDASNQAEEPDSSGEPDRTEPTSVPTKPGTSATRAPEPTPVNTDASGEDKAKKRQAIDKAVGAEMERLRAACQAESDSLVRQITQELAANENGSIKEISDQYLDQVFAAEDECDAKFEQLVNGAKEEYAAAGLSDESLPDWSSQYESAKEQARAAAVNAIAGAIKP